MEKIYDGGYANCSRQRKLCRKIEQNSNHSEQKEFKKKLPYKSKMQLRIREIFLSGNATGTSTFGTYSFTPGL